MGVKVCGIERDPFPFCFSSSFSTIVVNLDLEGVCVRPISLLLLIQCFDLLIYVFYVNFCMIRCHDKIRDGVVRMFRLCLNEKSMMNWCDNVDSVLWSVKLSCDLNTISYYVFWVVGSQILGFGVFMQCWKIREFPQNREEWKCSWKLLRVVAAVTDSRSIHLVIILDWQQTWGENESTTMGRNGFYGGCSKPLEVRMRISILRVTWVL